MARGFAFHTGVFTRGIAEVRLTILHQLDMPAYRELMDSGKFDVDLEAPNQNDANPISLAALRFYRPSGVPSSVNFAPGGRFDEVIEKGLAELVRDGVQRRSAEAQKISSTMKRSSYLLED